MSEGLARISQATAARASLKIVWRDRIISLRCVLSWSRSFCMHEKPGHSPPTFNAEYKQWTWDVAGDSSTYRIQNTSQRRRYAIGSSMQLAHTKTCLQLPKWSINDMAISQDLLVSQILSCKEQWMVAEEGVVRESDGKITSKNVRVWVLSKDRKRWREVIRRSVMVSLRPPEVMG